MENKIYCWHASFNNSFIIETFGAGFGKTDFARNIYKRLKDERGVKGHTLFIVDFFRGNARMYFAIDDIIYQLTNLMAYDYHDMEIKNVSTGENVDDRELLNVRDYINCVLISRNVGNICQRIQIGKPLAFLEITFDDNIISDYKVQNILKELFENQYSDFSIYRGKYL